MLKLSIFFLIHGIGFLYTILKLNIFLIIQNNKNVTFSRKNLTSKFIKKKFSWNHTFIKLKGSLIAFIISMIIAFYLQKKDIMYKFSKKHEIEWQLTTHESIYTYWYFHSLYLNYCNAVLLIFPFIWLSKYLNKCVCTEKQIACINCPFKIWMVICINVYSTSVAYSVFVFTQFSVICVM